MPALWPERVRSDLDRLAHRGLGVAEFFALAARVLKRAVPFDGVCLLTLDPATRLPTGEVVENALPPAARVHMGQVECGAGDFKSWDGLARSGQAAARLGAGRGAGDELRLLASDGSAVWAGLTLLRTDDRADFTAAEIDLLASVSLPLAEGIRRALVLREPAGPDGAGDDRSGLLVLDPNDELAHADAVAEQWLAELGDDAALPVAVTAVAAQARSILDGTAPPGAVARARVLTRSGSWLVLRGSVLSEESGGPAAVIVERAHPHELAPLVADAYGLTERERAITALVARGMQTEAIASSLFISPWTVQDHLKSVFEKLCVSTRGELIARLFFEHYAPRLD